MTVDNILSLVEPELASEAHGWDPTTVTSGSNVRRPWVCRLSHVWEATVANRVKGTGCPYCNGKKVLAGFNDLATTNPELAAQACDWDPTTVTSGSDRVVEWRCDQGHQWQAKVCTRNRGASCPYCAGKKVLAGFNDLATTHPELAEQAYHWDPTTVTAGSNKITTWRCELDHFWEASVNNRSHGSGCPDCYQLRRQVDQRLQIA
jgi:hypothetical protein